MSLCLFELGYLGSSVGTMSGLMTNLFALVVFGAMSMSVMKLIEAAIGLHYLLHNTERTLASMESHVNLSLVMALFVSFSTISILLVSNHHKDLVTLDLIESIRQNHQVEAGENILSTLRFYDTYLFGQLVYFLVCVWSFKSVQVMEKTKTLRLIDNQSCNQ